MGANMDVKRICCLLWSCVRRCSEHTQGAIMQQHTTLPRLYLSELYLICTAHMLAHPHICFVPNLFLLQVECDVCAPQVNYRKSISRPNDIIITLL
jgi:hypothetical protein